MIGVPTSSQLAILLNDNHIGDPTFSQLAQLLSGKYLRELRLSGIELGHEGGALLADFLRRNSAILQLDLSFTNLGVVGCAKVATAVADINRSLQFLDISGNIAWHKDGRSHIRLGASAMTAAATRGGATESLPSGGARPLVPIPTSSSNVKELVSFLLLVCFRNDSRFFPTDTSSPMI